MIPNQATYHIHYFGLLAERRGLAKETLSSPAATPAELYSDVARIHPLGLSTEHFKAAVNDEFVSWNHPLGNGDHVAFMPPMSGG
jgi:molybdopterin converting factor small subunit